MVDDPSRIRQAGFIARLIADVASIVERGDSKHDARLAWRRAFGESMPRGADTIISFYPNGRILIRYRDGRWEIRRWPGNDAAGASLLERKLERIVKSGRDGLADLFGGLFGDDR